MIGLRAMDGMATHPYTSRAPGRDPPLLLSRRKLGATRRLSSAEALGRTGISSWASRQVRECARTATCLTFDQWRHGLELDPEVVFILEPRRVVHQLNVAYVDLGVSLNIWRSIAAAASGGASTAVACYSRYSALSAAVPALRSVQRATHHDGLR